MSKETILIVDDEPDILELIQFHFHKEGYKVITAKTGEEAIEITKRSYPDLIVLDLMLPGIDGLEVTKILKQVQNTNDIPIVMLTAKGEEADIVTGLELGANDYISKPFSPKELTARIRAILRRRRQKESQPSLVSKEGQMVIDRPRHLVLIDGKPIDLTISEFELVSFLAEKKGWVFTRGQLVDAIHGENYAVTERSIDVIVVGLRKKLKHCSSLIETVRGVGYRFKE